MSIESGEESVPQSESAGTEAVGASPQASRAALRYVDRPDCTR
jgi:hypothetical protein